MKNLTLDLTGYTVRGLADVSLWGGGEGNIEMKPFNVKSIKEIPEKLNDGGFGVEKINGAIVDVYRDYNGFKKYSRTLIINEVSNNTINTFYNEY